MSSQLPDRARLACPSGMSVLCLKRGSLVGLTGGLSLAVALVVALGGCAEVVSVSDASVSDDPDAAVDADVRCPDGDMDTVCDADDVCVGSDDLLDADSDQIPDACDCDQAGSTCSVNATCTESTEGVTCTCDLGYEGDGIDCMPVDCGLLVSPANGLVVVPSTLFGATATYSCSLGYLLEGATTRTCQQAGWSGKAPVCTIRDCGVLAAPVNGTVSAPVTTFDSAATYSCNASHQLLGSIDNRCGPDGQWLGAPPTCGPVIDCACGGVYSQGERVRAIVDNPGNANALPQGTLGTVIAGAGGGQPLIEWDGWFNGHDGNCGVAQCGTCTASGNSRWYVACNEVETLRLTCVCGGTFSEGDRVVALVDNPTNADALPQGTLGTVIAGGGTPPLLIEWDGWFNGHNGNCTSAQCGTCTASGDSRRYVACSEVGLAP